MQVKIIQYIISHTERFGTAPSLRGLMSVCDVTSVRGVEYKLNALQQAGFINRQGRRFIVLKNPSGKPLKLKYTKVSE